MNTTLYIIGNGFDRMHNMKTMYADYKEWLKNNLRDDIIRELESVFDKSSDKSILWSDFEKALGQYDFETAANWDLGSLCLLVLTDGHKTKVLGNPPYINASLKDIVNTSFTSWVKEIEIAHRQIITLDKEALFLSFNYTETLECVYSISPSQVFHIHGYRKTDDKIIVGHDNEIDPTSAYIEGNDIRNNNERLQHICDMNNLAKPVQTIIEKANSFWRKLSNIDRVIVIGHSCNNVDFPYFEKVTSSILKNAQWVFYCHTDVDIVRVEKMTKTLGITKFQIKQS